MDMYMYTSQDIDIDIDIAKQSVLYRGSQCIYIHLSKGESQSWVDILSYTNKNVLEGEC